VRAADIRDHTDRWFGDGGQRRDLAAMIHAHFDDRVLGGFAARQQRERNTEIVVEIAARRQRRSYAVENSRT